LSYESGSGVFDVTAKWNAGVLDGEYTNLLVNMSGVLYGKFDFDAPITMDHEGTALELTIRRSITRTLQEGTWI
jgi:hypothetical protein